jgi:hypothetical protein
MWDRIDAPAFHDTEERDRCCNRTPLGRNVTRPGNRNAQPTEVSGNDLKSIRQHRAR